ncbi:hypothetical protein BDZ85DRAFT_124761 [Elsinoe ampelina]|uniref:Secreted protein n=1 Tax=Elsinoe ampelina TaxID=302913 RepID=A0A6A6FXL6_9PEZI|nr:hypothetical protein BDZ85DRAFT_124761 [Elsinoe ampelina]
MKLHVLIWALRPLVSLVVSRTSRTLHVFVNSSLLPGAWKDSFGFCRPLRILLGSFNTSRQFCRLFVQSFKRDRLDGFMLPVMLVRGAFAMLVASVMPPCDCSKHAGVSLAAGSGSKYFTRSSRGVPSWNPIVVFNPSTCSARGSLYMSLFVICSTPVRPFRGLLRLLRCHHLDLRCKATT